MTRYFLTTNASRPYIAGGLTFSFEPVQNRGGSWLGVLAVADEAAASALAGAQLAGVDEIDDERYDSVKKKLGRTSLGRNESQKPQRVPTPRGEGAVSLAEQRGATRGVGNPLIPRRAEPITPVIESVSLQTTSAEPPREALLEQPSMPSGKKWAGKANK